MKTETQRLYGKAREQLRSVRKVRARDMGGRSEQVYLDLFRFFREMARTERTLSSRYGSRPAAF
jgi:hypothetical protein